MSGRVLIALVSFVLLGTGCAPNPGQTPLATVPPPATCRDQLDPRQRTDPSFRVKVGETVELALKTVTLAGQSAAGVLAGEKLPDRIRFTPLRPGASDAYVMNAGGLCIVFSFEVRP